METNKNVMSVESGGVVFNVRIVEQDDNYGLKNVLVHDKEMPLVEFYDSRFKDKFTEYGQFVSRYYLDTLLDRKDDVGLCLQGGVPEWGIEREGMLKVTEWLKEFVSKKQLTEAVEFKGTKFKF